MANTSPKKCMGCGEVAVVPVRRGGRTGTYSNVSALDIPADFPIPTCANCGVEWLDHDTAEGLDRVLEVAYQRQRQDDIDCQISGGHPEDGRISSLMELTPEGAIRLQEILENPPEPTPELIALLREGQERLPRS